MSGLIPGVRNNGVILVGLASLPGSTQMLVVTAAGLIESQAIPSGAWNDITGKPTEFPPSAHNHAATQITSGTLDDARLSSNVPRLNAANTFTQTQLIGAQLGVGPGSANSFYFDSAFNLKVWNGGSIGWSAASGVGNATTVDISIRRNATGPTLETRAAGGLKVCNADGSAVAALESANISLDQADGANPDSDTTGNRQLRLRTAGSTWFYIARWGTNRRIWMSNEFVLSPTNWTMNGSQVQFSSGGSSVRFRSANVTFRNVLDNADAPIVVGNVTSSGVVQGTFLPTPFTVATLPSAAANTGRTAQVTDSSVDFTGNIGATVAGGGVFNVDVKSNGTNWRITG